MAYQWATGQRPSRFPSYLRRKYFERPVGWAPVARKRRLLRRLASAILVALGAFLALAAAGCRCPAPVTPAAAVAQPPAACLDAAPPRRPVLKFSECAGWGACLAPEDLAALDAWARRLNGWAGEAWARCGAAPVQPAP